MASYEQNKSSKTWSVRFREMEDGIIVNKRLSGFARKKDAEQGYAEYLRQQRLKELNPEVPKKVLFNDVVEMFLQAKKNNLKYSSFYTLERKFKKNIMPFFEGKYINEITPFDLAEWQGTLKDLKYGTKSHLRSYMGSIWRFAEKYYDIKNIFIKTEPFRDLEAPKDIQYWTLEQFQKFLSVTDKEVYRVFFTFLYLMGCRKGEALALTWNDIDFDKKEVYICKSVTHKTQNVAWEITTPKNRSSTRRISIPDNLIETLKRFKIWQKENYSDTTFIFCGERPLPEETIKRYFKIYTEKAELPPIRIHDLRHSCASLLISEGATIVAVANRLGHANIEQTLNTYSHMMPKDEKDILDTLGKLGTI